MKTQFLTALLGFTIIKCCFITHFVYYGELNRIEYERIRDYNSPYILHLN